MQNKTPRRIDVRTQYKFLYSPSAKAVETIDVPELKFIMVDGSGDTTSDAFQNAIQTLYNLSFTTKFAMKKEEALDYPVMALEGLWWTKSSEKFDLQSARKDWNWTLMIMQPALITRELFAASAGAVGKKKELPALEKVRFERFQEGKSAQVLHVGPYADEPATVGKLHEFVQSQGYKLRGKHHEIYLSDPRRTAPEKLKTIVRQPVEPA